MGVLTLWPLLEAARETCDVQSLSGKTLAVDLSGWICEACALRATAGKINKPHIRTLFFRVALLYRLNVRLVFVCDGKAVELKYDTIAKRIDVRNGRSAAASSGKSKSKCSRSQLNRRVKECVDLLTALGIPTIKAKGEAEALCALLNAAGLVDGCITEDSDVFLYGAKVVYRGLSTSSREMEVSRYSADDIASRLGFDRSRLISMALLLGCDYLPNGVPGVGKETALKLLRSISGDILDRFSFWKQCSGRSAEIQSSVEVNVCRKALSLPDFPFPAVTGEYLSPDECLPKSSFKWNRPQIQHACGLLINLMEWPALYAWEKVFPLVTHRHLMTCKSPPDLLHPSAILKSCVRSGVPCYEIAWRGEEARQPATEQQPEATGATSSADRTCSSSSSAWMVSIERRDLIENVHPSLVHQYAAQLEQVEQAKKAAGSKKRREKKAATQSKSGSMEDKENEVASLKSVSANPDIPCGLADRLKAKAASTSTKPSAISDSQEVEVASINPFKLHDESLEVLQAKGFDHALAGLDISMANFSLNEQEMEEIDQQVLAASSFNSLSPPTAIKASGERHGTHPTKIWSDDFKESTRSWPEDRKEIIHGHTGVPSASPASLKTAADVSSAGETLLDRPASSRDLPYISLADRIRRQRKEAKKSLPVASSEHEKVQPVPLANSSISKPAVTNTAQPLDGLDYREGLQNSHHPTLTSPECQLSNPCPSAYVDSAGVDMSCKLSSLCKEPDIEAHRHLTDSTLADGKSLQCSAEASMYSAATLHTREESPTRKTSSDPELPPEHHDVHSGNLNGCERMDGSWSLMDIDSGVLRTMGDCSIAGDDTGLLVSLDLATPTVTPVAQRSRALRCLAMDSPMDTVSPAVARCLSLSRRSPAHSSSPMSDSMAMDVGLLLSLDRSTPRASGFITGHQRRLKSLTGTSTRPIVLD